MFLEMIKSIVLGIVEGISEWLPISSTGHMILVNELINNTEGFTASDLYLYVIQLGAILAVVTLYFHKLNPFSPKKTNVEKENTWKMWFKVIIPVYRLRLSVLYLITLCRLGKIGRSFRRCFRFLFPCATIQQL